MDAHYNESWKYANESRQQVSCDPFLNFFFSERAYEHTCRRGENEKGRVGGGCRGGG